MPGQVEALQKRIEVLVPDRDRRVKELAAATAEAASLADTDTAGSDRARKRAARLKTEVAAVNGEMETLRSLVAARLAQSPRPY